MGWFFEYWKEFYLTIGGLVLLCLIIAFWMDFRNYRKRMRNRKDRKDWWRD